MSEHQDNEQREPELLPGERGERADAPAADVEPGRKEMLTVVGIGASAGGLAALQGFFDSMPADTGMAFVVVIHMDPERESLLPEILQQHTAMPVRQVQDLTVIEPDHVYVIPPGRRILVTDTHLDTKAFEEPRGRRTPVDYFFRSLARVHRQAVAVILSGGGTDGAVGVKAIKEEGGLLMVQDPAEAEHDSMPRAAIATGLADIVLPVAELAQKLIEYQTNGVHVPTEPEALTGEELETLYRILTQVKAHTGHDFSQYKHSTLLRRIQRRTQLNGHQTLDAYLSNLRHDAVEARALFNDLLIGVTNFFRDGEAWEALAETVIPRLFENKEQGDSVRVWSIGCATGEEAYSLAILLLEHAATLERPPALLPDLQVFASDLDKDALQKAREGVYPEAIEADVSPERLQRWFVKEGHYYRVKQELRDIVLFSNHSVLHDPPFSRLDLVSCRNLLIYLNRDLQENVFRIFHYGLRPESYLFLGSAESAEMVHGLFHTLDKQHRLYRARPDRGAHPQLPSLPLSVPRGRRGHLPAAGERRRTPVPQQRGAIEGLHKALLEEAAPPSVLVDEEHQVLHISESAGRYLLHPRGRPTSGLLKLVRPELHFELRSALFQTFEHGQPALSRPVLVRFNGGADALRRVILAVQPQQGDGGEPLALVFFLEDAARPAGAEGEQAPAPEVEAGTEAAQHTPMLARLEAENRRLRERLQATTEEYESSHEELKAANEELQSVNEEYRTTTEELETSKEELQSLNEELQTVNTELKNKLREVSQAHGDLENLLMASDNATLFLDRELRIRRYTPSTAELFNIMPADRGRPIDHLTNRLQYDRLSEDAAQVLEALVPIEREVQDREGRWFLAQLRPYRTVDDRIDGIVLTFVDIGDLKETEAALRTEKEYGEKIVHTVREGLLVLVPDLTVEFANDSFYQMFDVSPGETTGELVYNLGNGQWDIPELRTLLEEILPERNVFSGYRVEHDFESVGRRVMLLNARRLDHVDKILLAIEDITEREQYEQQLRESEERYRTLFESIDQGFCIVEVLFDDDEPVDYRFLEVNPAFEEQTGLQDAEGNRMRALEPRHEEHWFQVYGRIALTGEPQRFTQEAKYLDNRWYDVYAFRMGQPEERKVAILFNDISERKQAEEALRESEARYRELAEALEEQVEGLKRLHAMTARVVAAGQMQTALDEILSATVELVEADLGDIQLLDSERGELKILAHIGFQQSFLDAFRIVSAADETACGRALRSGQRVAIEDVAEDAAYRPYRPIAEEAGYRAVQSTPLVNRGGEILGVLSTHFREPRVLSERDQHYLDLIARQAADLLDRLQAEQRLEERVEERTAQVEALAGELTMAEHEERGRIAQVLHDDLQQQLYALQMQLTFLRAEATPAAEEEIEVMEEVVQTAIQTARRLSVDLSPPILEGEGLTEAVGWLAKLMAERHRLQVEVEAEDSFVIPDVDRRVLLFQAVRELLFNVVKHARTPEATVWLQLVDEPEQERAYRIDVVDEGVGFDPEAVLGPEARRDGRGLLHIQQRLSLIGGRLEVASIPGDGTRVTMVAPADSPGEGEQPVRQSDSR